MSEPSGRAQRSSVGGLIGAMLVLLLGIGAFVVLRDVNRVAPGDPVRPVDYAQPARFARRAADFELLAPRRLPAGWIATSVRFEDTPGKQSWHVGVLTDAKRYIGLEQAERTVPSMVEEFLGEDATEAGDVDVDGEQWARWTDPERDPDADPAVASENGDMALVREADGSTGSGGSAGSAGATTLVVGRASQEQLTQLAASLH
jgi:hypothetical protein